MPNTGMIKLQQYENPNFPEETLKYSSWPPDKGVPLTPTAGGESRAG